MARTNINGALPGGDYETVLLQDAATATGNGTVAQVQHAENGIYASLAMQVSGTFSATITFEATVDGTNWVAMLAENLTTGSSATTATAAGIYRILTHSLLQVRARISAYTSGNVTVFGRLGA